MLSSNTNPAGKEPTQGLTGASAGQGPPTASSTAATSASTSISAVTAPASSQLTASSTSSGPVSSSTSAGVGLSAPRGNGSNAGISGGALAGAVVGSVVVAALISSIITFLIVRRNMRHRSSSHRPGHDNGTDGKRRLSNRQADFGEKSRSKEMTNNDFTWQTYLPQSADDQTMQSAVKTFLDQVELHVDNYYRRVNVELDDVTLQGLAEVDTGHLPRPIQDLIQKPQVALWVIKHCIVGLLVAQMCPTNDPTISLLPPGLSELPPKLASPSLPLNEKRAATQAYSQWKSLNAYLFPQPLESRRSAKDLKKLTSDISKILSTAFFLWRNSSQDVSALQQHEKVLIASAARVGVLIISQPSMYEFQWQSDDPAAASGGLLVTTPSFVKTSNERGQPLPHPQVLLAQVAARF